MNEQEKNRQILQIKIDNSKSIEERRKFGQFSTPYNLAEEIVSYGLQLHEGKIKFLDPAFGTGVFYSVLNEKVKENENLVLDSCCGVEIDPAYFKVAKSLWSLPILLNKDFTELLPTKKYDFLISNPPYVRNQLIESKKKNLLAKQVKAELGIEVSGLMGLYCYFILLSHKWLSKNAVSGWLIPSEFMDVNYGDILKNYLLNDVHLLRVHRYDPSECKFNDALVSSCVVWFKNEKIEDDYDIEFSFGGTLNNPIDSKKIKKGVLLKEQKWTRFPQKDIRLFNKNILTLGDFFEIKRGIATGDNDFFILSKNDILKKGLPLSEKYFQPILPSPRNLKINKVISDEVGIPKLDIQYFLLNCNGTEKITDDSVIKYLKTGEQTTKMKYICRNRKTWYQQEKRSPTTFLCSYMGRSSKNNPNPFRFILNKSKAIVTNSYLMLYPKENLKKLLEENSSNLEVVWNMLNQITALDFAEEQRIYGGGLKKIEPHELARVRCKNLQDLIIS